MNRGNDQSVFKSPEARRAVLEAYEAALARWPLPCERLRFATGAGETAALAFGSADAARQGDAVDPMGDERQPLIVLHGTGSNSSMWLGAAAVLTRDRRVFAVDIPGEPGMSEDARLEWKPERCGTWLAQVASTLCPRGHDLLGLSIGGWIALAYAVGKPAGLGALALLCPSGIGRPRPSFMLKGLLAMARGQKGLEALSRSLYGDFSPPEEAIRVGTLMAMSTNARMEEPKLFADEELAGIEARLFLAVGTKDALLRSGESAERLGRLKPDADIRALPGAGHALVGLGAEVVDFLDRGRPA